MTSRYSGLIVILDDEFRDDYVKQLAESIKLLKGVKDVELAGEWVPHHYFHARRILEDVRIKVNQCFSEPNLNE